MSTQQPQLVVTRGVAPPRYAPPSTGLPIDLRLDANEGMSAGIDVASVLATLDPDTIHRYPSTAPLESALASAWNIEPARVVVTAGGDEAIDRACRAFLGPGREIVLPTPTFEMIGRYATLAGAKILTTDWNTGAYPLASVLRLVTDRTAMIAVVSPNNPTGATASTRDVQCLAEAAPNAVILLDAAYAEFADEDLTPAALGLPNVIVIRTFSKAFGLASIRVGYAICGEAHARALRAVGSPFPVSGLSLALALEAHRVREQTLPSVVAAVRQERAALMSLLEEFGAKPTASQGNFVLATFSNAEGVWRSLASKGIAVRRFAVGHGLDNALRITCPGHAPSFARLCSALRCALHTPTVRSTGETLA